MTLSICGLGMLDESEVETIPAAEQPAPALEHRPEEEKRAANGRRLQERVEAQEKKLVSEGRCKPGDLFAHVIATVQVRFGATVPP